MADTWARPVPAKARVRPAPLKGGPAVPALIAVMLLSLPMAAHDFWIEPSTFIPALNSVVNLRLRVGEHVEGEAVARNASAIETFVVASGEGRRQIAGRDGGDPAGVFRVMAPGTMVVAYRSRPSTVELPAAEFEQYLKEEGLEHVIEARARRGESGAPGREQFSRSVKTLLHANGTRDPRSRCSRGVPSTGTDPNDPA